LIRLIGFEELGGKDGFSTGTLELRLSQSGGRYFGTSVIVSHQHIGVLAKPVDDTIPTMYGTSGKSRPSRGFVRASRQNGGDDGSDLDI
jgi:hypothetical protein